MLKLFWFSNTRSRCKFTNTKNIILCTQKNSINHIYTQDEIDKILTRDNKCYHFTSSAWVVSPDFKKVLMVYHNIYNSWSWMGGHADGESDLLKVAIKEVKEESGNVVEKTETE